MYTKEQLLEAIRLAQIIQYYDLDAGRAVFSYTEEEIIEKITPPPPVKVIQDLSNCFYNKFPLNDKNITMVFKSHLLDEIREDTPHGEEGTSELSQHYIINGVEYVAYITDVRWDRHDKQFYFIDTYHSPTVEWEIID